MSQNATPKQAFSLSPKQSRVLESLLSGETVTASAESGGVVRETVHRWLKQDWRFQAALNRGTREPVEAIQARLIATAKTSASNISEAVEQGDVKASLAILKGIGALSGHLPTAGSEDPTVLREEAELSDREEQTSLMMRGLLAG